MGFTFLSEEHFSVSVNSIIFTANTQWHRGGELQVNAAHLLSFWFD